jgi:hypothetical protein
MKEKKSYGVDQTSSGLTVYKNNIQNAAELKSVVNASV